MVGEYGREYVCHLSVPDSNIPMMIGLCMKMSNPLKVLDEVWSFYN